MIQETAHRSGRLDKSGDVTTALAATGAREHRTFAGHVNAHQLGFAERAMVRAFRSAVGDFRDWAEITEWARTIGSQLSPTRT